MGHKAHQVLAGAEHALDTRRERLKRRLETELADPRIAAAIEQLNALVECRGPDDCVQPSRASISARFEHVVHVARPALNELYYRDAEHLDSEIAAVLDAVPPLAPMKPAPERRVWGF